MILTVTLNPLIEFRFSYINPGKEGEHREGNESYLAGGKGINVSRQLNTLHSENISLTFAGGKNGKLLREQLTAEKINHTCVRIASETRKAAVVTNMSGRRIYTFFGSSPSVSESEVEEFKSKLSKMISNCEVVVFSGSSPCAAANSIFPFGISEANRNDKISICDTYGSHLLDCLNSSPTIVHNNLDETRESLGLKLNSEQEILSYLNSLYEKGIKQVCLTDGDKPVYASNFDFHYKCSIPAINVIDPTGSGDCVTAGLAYSIATDLTFIDSLKFSLSLGTINSTMGNTCEANPAEANELKEKFVAEAIGKKIKLIDDTPL